ncbi:carbon-nitrogen hydrolase family protein [Mucilaginibacter segetis]|uniref:Carbon-nitrogen hydrolase family protein n=1 Tax=Mucilaginibacter segetis TaxID=2793071 RepID=A0A934PU51_9SPHI|nr:carbon-nitrogen hydrolase family protein [Mucilaginibacter segetis]MBK0379063.1 carbon-nitrogen hydrolase family protein [Mucilaginibacter segetis]
MKIALAYAPYPKNIADGLYWINKLAAEAAAGQAEIICFPESYIPGYPGTGFEPEARSPEKLRDALDEVENIAYANNIAVIIPMDWYGPNGLLNLVYVVSASGELLGYQTKNQLDPTEDNIWIPGTERSLFEVNGLKFGITICHEGFRYPESVRWAAREGASVVFHPHCTGDDASGLQLTDWGHKNNPYYEKAMMLRAMENTIYFASVNYGFKYPESGSAVIAPDGTCIAGQPYGKAGIIIADIDPAQATGLLAKRFKPELYKW